MPSSRISSLRTSRKPLGYLPSGAADETQTPSDPPQTRLRDTCTTPHAPVWKRDFSTSGGIATAQLKIPAIPPANRMLGTLSSVGLNAHTHTHTINAGHVRISNYEREPSRDPTDLLPSGVSAFFSHSYVMKYIPLAGTSDTQRNNCQSSDIL